MHYRVIEPSILPARCDQPLRLLRSSRSCTTGSGWPDAYFNTCPDFGRRLVDDPYKKLEKDLEAYQASLAVRRGQDRDLHERHQASCCGGSTRSATARSSSPSRRRRENRAGQGRELRRRQGHRALGIRLPAAAPSRALTSPAEPTTLRPTGRSGWREHVFSFRDDPTASSSAGTSSATGTTEPAATGTRPAPRSSVAPPATSTSRATTTAAAAGRSSGTPSAPRSTPPSADNLVNQEATRLS